jgi:hypothetical protein
MTVARRTQWQRLLAESIAVIASILIAFAIDAAWEARGENNEAREILEGLRAELKESMVLADSTLVLAGEMYRWLYDFHTASPDEASRIPREQTYMRVYMPFAAPRHVALPTDFLDATINSGKLALIEDPETREALSRVRNAHDNVDQMLQQVSEVQARATPVLGEFDGVRYMRAGPDEDAEVSIDPATVRELNMDRRVAGYASAIMIYSEGYLYGVANLLKPALEEALRLVERDLQR